LLIVTIIKSEIAAYLRVKEGQTIAPISIEFNYMNAGKKDDVINCLISYVSGVSLNFRNLICEFVQCYITQMAQSVFKTLHYKMSQLICIPVIDNLHQRMWPM